MNFTNTTFSVTASIPVAALVAIGGNEWTGSDNHRVYFNDLAERLGLVVDYFKTGNVCFARLDGERISNTYARSLLHSIDDVKCWFDINRSEFCVRGLDGHAAEALINGLISDAEQIAA